MPLPASVASITDFPAPSKRELGQFSGVNLPIGGKFEKTPANRNFTPFLLASLQNHSMRR